MKSIRIFIATTGGVAAVERITPEKAPQSMVCLRRTSQVLSISGLYDDFVRAGSGVITREFGGESFRLDLSAPIDTGISWQLGVYLAHAVFVSRTHRLADADEAADQNFIVSGTVNYDLEIGPVDHVNEKMCAAAATLDELGASTQVLMPSGINVEQATAALSGSDAVIIGCADVREACWVVGIEGDKITALVAAPTDITALQVAQQRRHITRYLKSGAVAGVVILGLSFRQELAHFFGLNNEAPVVASPIQAMTASTPEKQVEQLGSMNVMLLYPPDGGRCSTLLFGGKSPKVVPYDKNAVRPCGLQVRIMPAVSGTYARLSLDIENGRLIPRSANKSIFMGDAPVDREVVVLFDIPLEYRGPIDVMLQASFAKAPISGNADDGDLSPHGSAANASKGSQASTQIHLPSAMN